MYFMYYVKGDRKYEEKSRVLTFSRIVLIQSFFYYLFHTISRGKKKIKGQKKFQHKHGTNTYNIMKKFQDFVGVSPTSLPGTRIVCQRGQYFE